MSIQNISSAPEYINKFIQGNLEQLNKIYDDGLTKWKSEMVDPIKAKYPKP